MLTQTNETGLIRLTLTALADGNQPQVTAILWITPQNLYVQGYSDNAGNTFVFPDTPANVRSRIGMAAQAPTGQLTFASTYNRLVQAAGRGREAMPVSFQELRQSTLNLAIVGVGGHPSQMEVARALMFMIQFTSEAARINDVFETMSSAQPHRAADVTAGAGEQLEPNLGVRPQRYPVPHHPARQHRRLGRHTAQLQRCRAPPAHGAQHRHQ